jgi:hypothetical protein
MWFTVFEDKSLVEKATVAVEKTIHHEAGDDQIGEKGIDHMEVEHKAKGL